MLSLLFFIFIFFSPSVMKNKVFDHLFLALIFVLVSCTPDSIIKVDNDTSIMTLRATFAGEPDTRTEFGLSTESKSHSQIWWKAGDQINVFSADASAQYSTEQGGKTAEFTGETLSGSSFLGLSPYDGEATANVSSKSISATIPTVQKAYADAFDPAALVAVGYSKTTQMSFYNVCSGLRFTLTGTNISKYRQIELTGNNNEVIAGPVSISCSNATAPVVSSLQNCSKVVSLVLPEKGSFAKGKTYFLLFSPGIFSKGFTLSFKDADGNTLVTSTCSSYVEFKRSVFASIDGADNPQKLAAIRDGELLSKSGTANCYIVSKPGSYKFPISRATEDDYIPGFENMKVSVLWETDNTVGTQTVGSIITEVVKNKGFVYFNTPTTLKDGNAVIAASLDNNIVWSWHIWVCAGYNPATTSQTYTGKNAAMMDRNLGALEASKSSPLSNGLFYQWGRKDPFPGAAESYVASGGHFMSTTKAISQVSSESVDASVDYAVAHPNTYITTTKNNGDWLASPDVSLWAESKTVYDPCPPGWKVPSIEAWSDLPEPSSADYGIYLDAVRAWYPDNGYMSLAGKLLMVGQSG